MPTEVLLWLGGTVVIVVLGLLGLVYKSLERRGDKTEGKVEKHAERLARIEPQVERNTEEIGGLRNRTHKLESDEAYRGFRDKHPDG